MLRAVAVESNTTFYEEDIDANGSLVKSYVVEDASLKTSSDSEGTTSTLPTINKMFSATFKGRCVSCFRRWKMVPEDTRRGALDSRTFAAECCPLWSSPAARHQES
mgnify:CR=1 FL=1